MKIDEKKLSKLQENLPVLNELDMLGWVWNSDIKRDIFNDLCDTYLISDDAVYADDSEKISEIRPYIIEWFGEDHAFAIKDDEYILISFAIVEDDIKYWDVSKINVGNQEMARKIAYMVDYVSNIDM